MIPMRFLVGGAVAAGLVAATVWALLPQPAAVDLAEVTRAPLQVTLTSEGVTRVRESHTITAPIAGTTTRAPVQVGDAVTRGETVVAVIQPVAPALMDARSRAQAEAAVIEAGASVQLAEANLRQAQAANEHARHEYQRGQALAGSGTIPQRMLEDLAQARTAAENALAAAEAQRELSLAALSRAQAQLVGPGSQMQPEQEPGECCVRMLSPVTGTVLDIVDRNAREVAAGTPLMTLGDLADLEIEIDLLSPDAIRVAPGMAALVERWGGERDLEARVRRVEPAAFTRVSALGIEEQRVRVLLDLVSPPEVRPGLGERFRVTVRLVIWEGAEVLQVPHGALFRHADGWAVFRAEEGRARLTPVRIDRRGAETTQVVAGLESGDLVVLFPSNALADGDRITAR